jgi:hypothetical protein
VGTTSNAKIVSGTIHRLAIFFDAQVLDMTILPKFRGTGSEAASVADFGPFAKRSKAEAADQ